MKSIQRKAALLVIFAMTAVSVVNAQEEGAGKEAEEAGGIGLTVGLEVGFGNVVEEAEFSLTPNVVYENSFLNGALDVFAEIDYTAAFSDPMAQDVYIEAEIGYNLGLIENGTLSVILSNINDTIRIAPELEDGETHLGVFEPSLKWTQTLGFGDLWLQGGLPITYLTGVEDETALGLTTTVGWDSTFGLGVEFVLDFILDAEGEDAGLAALGLSLSYDAGLISGEVELVADKEFEVIEIVPEIDVNLDFGLTIYAKAGIEIFNIEGVDMDPVFAPAIGVSYSF
jgi:hypothetical protein